MSVEEHLGLGPLLMRAGAEWSRWADQYPVLGAVSGPYEFRQWALQERPGTGEALAALAWLGSSSGGDDEAAAASLAWSLLPGACRLAGRLGEGFSDRVDHLVASELWIQCRSWSGSSTSSVASRILWEVRDAVCADLGRARDRGEYRMLARTVPVDPGELGESGQLADVVADLEQRLRASTSELELLQLLEWATSRGVISDDERGLLLSLVDAAHWSARSRSARGGLMSRESTERVGRRLGVGASTVRRRALRSIDALSDAALGWSA